MSTKTFGIFDVGIRITQKMVCYENHRNEAYARFGARLTLQMVRTIHDGQPMHIQGLDGRPRKNLAFFTSESELPKNRVL